MLATVTPLFAVGATLMTIDTVYIFFWTVAALTFWKAKDQDALGWWVITGLLVGLSMLSKYTGAIELVSFGLFCLWETGSRRHFRQWTIPSMLLVVGICLVPMLLWNWQHGFPTSHFLLHRGALDEQMHLRPQEVLSFLVQQAGIISPIFFLGLLLAVCVPRFSPTPRVPTIFLLSLFLPLFLVYLILSFQKASQANWPAAAYVAGLVLLAAKGSEAVVRQPWIRWLAATGLAVAFFETALLHDTSWLHLPGRLDPLDRARGSRDLASQIETLRTTAGAPVVIANKYMTAALMSFYLPGQPDTFMPVSSPPFNQLVLWPTYREKYPLQDAVYLSDVNRVPASISADFPAIESAREIRTTQDGRPIALFYVFVCRRSATNNAAVPK